MKTALVQPTERVKLTWWQRVIVALGFVVVVFIGSTTGHVLFDPSSVAAAFHADFWPRPESGTYKYHQDADWGRTQMRKGG